jgi:hypothetical protein
VLLPFKQEDDRRQRKLKECPKGFHLEGKGYSCAICSGTYSDEDTWYDQHGVKCMNCQAAIDRGEIPPACAENRDGWYSVHDLESDFGANRWAVRRWAKAGILKARRVKREGREGTLLFLIEDNKDALPPKELVKDYSIHERTSDGGVRVHIEPWYRHVDPYIHLKGYKIMEQLEYVDGRLSAKKKEK